jgi:hypothetical protein
MKYWFCDTPDNTSTNIKAHELIDTFSDIEGFERFLNENPQARDEMLNKINHMQSNGYIDKIDIFINVIYFSLRALHGVVLIVKANDLAAKETNEAVTDWSDFISNVINVAYMMTMLVYNNWQKHKTEKDKTEVVAVDIEQPVYGSMNVARV